MFALIYQALLRFFGFGGTAATPPRTKKIPLSPVMQQLRDNARAEGPVSDILTRGQSVAILARHAGQRSATEAPPPVWKVKLARAILPHFVLQYLAALEVLGRGFPKQGSDDDAVFETRLLRLARYDLRTWLAALYSGKPVTIPSHIAAVLIQRAANALGQLQPQVMPEGQEPQFVAEAETQMCVVDLATKFCVFPRVIGRGDTDPIELPGTDKRFHRNTMTLSGWEFRLGYAGQVFEPPVIPDAAGDAANAVAELIPHEIPNQVKP
jgi:hypothetical protein